MKKVKLLVLLIGVILITGSISACSQSNETAEAGNGKDVVNIGFSGPLSGAAAYYGEATLNDLEKAGEEINEEEYEVDGKKYEIKLISIYDDYVHNDK